MYTPLERIICALCLAFALAGLLNLFFYNFSLAGLSPKRLSIIMFVPAALAAYYMQARPR